ncbi:MAG: DNA double-strand break repair nuclease NurA [Ferroplasma sp.]
MDTFSDFVDYLNTNRKTLKKELEMDKTSQLYLFYKSLFNANYHLFKPHDPDSLNIAATDSSEFIRMLYNGKNIVLIRAYTLYENKVTKEFHADMVAVDPVEQRNFTILLMEHAEHQSIIEFLKENSPDYVFIDGSLKGRISHLNKKLPVEGYENFMAEYFSTLKKLIRTAFDKNATLIFIAKSSYTECFKKFLLNQVRKTDENSAIIEKESAIYRNDHYLIRSFAEYPGYTAPIMYKYSLDGIDINYVSTDVVPDVNDLPVKAQVISRQFASEMLDKKAYNLDENIINLIFYGYTGYKVYNIWLVNVDKLVKFRSQEIEKLYMKQLEKTLGITFYETRGERRARIRA